MSNDPFLRILALLRWFALIIIPHYTRLHLFSKCSSHTSAIGIFLFPLSAKNATLGQGSCGLKLVTISCCYTKRAVTHAILTTACHYLICLPHTHWLRAWLAEDRGSGLTSRQSILFGAFEACTHIGEHTHTSTFQMCDTARAHHILDHFLFCHGRARPPLFISKHKTANMKHWCVVCCLLVTYAKTLSISQPTQPNKHPLSDTGIHPIPDVLSQEVAPASHTHTRTKPASQSQQAVAEHWLPL